MILSGSGVVKLCDYGSATTRVVRPTEDWTHQQRAMLEDEVCVPLDYISTVCPCSNISLNPSPPPTPPPTAIPLPSSCPFPRSPHSSSSFSSTSSLSSSSVIFIFLLLILFFSSPSLPSSQLMISYTTHKTFTAHTKTLILLYYTYYSTQVANLETVSNTPGTMQYYPLLPSS